MLVQISITIIVAEESRLWFCYPKNSSFNPFKANNTLKLVIEHVKKQFSNPINPKNGSNHKSNQINFLIADLDMFF